MEILKTIGISMLTLAIMAGIALGVAKAMDGQEQFECQIWKSQAATFSNFYLTKWQKEQCDHWQIKIKAPVQ